MERSFQKNSLGGYVQRVLKLYMKRLVRFKYENFHIDHRYINDDTTIIRMR